MSCAHLKELFDMCIKQQIKIGGSDLVRIVCKQCGKEEVCPTMLMEDYETQHPEVTEQDDEQGEQH